MMRLTAAIGMMVVVAAASLAAEKGGVYRLHSSDVRSISQGSCVAIQMPDKRQHFLTVGHVIGGNMQVENDGRFYPVETVASWPTHIEPVVLVRQVKPSGKWREYPLATKSPERGEQLCLAGFPRGRFRGFWSPVVDVQHLNDSYLVTRGEADHGASGGAVLTRAGELVGLISSVDRGETLSVNLWDTISRNRSPKGRQVQWRCERGRCYPMYVQPVYPAVVQQPARPVMPQPTEPPKPSIDMDEVLRDVNIEVVAWLERNKEELKGADGADGASPKLDLDKLADVITSKYSERIRGQDGESVSPAVLSSINARLSLLEQGRRVLIIDGDTVLDDETYKPGEAIVLDVQRLTQS